MTLVDHRGNTLKSLPHARPKKPKPIEIPKIGDSFGQWAGRETAVLTLPGGGVMQFDLSQLTLSDFRAMRQHYQLGASLNVLTFIMHQIEWFLECENSEIEDFVTGELQENWTPLIRGISQAFWAGFAPNALNWTNSRDGYVRIDKIKDLIPEEVRIRWKKTEGWAEPGKPKPKIFHYDGLYQQNSLIPAANTLWYPLLMENGDHYGRKLLKPAFPSWFFSQLIHLFANRYFERFGEPLPIGRAPYGENVDLGDGTSMSAKDAMESIVMNIRNRAVTVLDSARDPDSGEYEWGIEYLESQMRGADFERYLSRLDEEMSLSVFTPVLLFRTADVGSYNLGQAHLRIFQQMLNAISGDLEYYIQHYLVDRMVVLNFGEDAPRCKWKYRKQGLADLQMYKELMNAVVQQGGAKPNLKDLASITGIEWEKVEEVTTEPAVPEVDPETGETKKLKLAAAKQQLNEAALRAVQEFNNGATSITLGFRNRVRNAILNNGGGDRTDDIVNEFYDNTNKWLGMAVPLAEDADHLMSMLKEKLPRELEAVAA